MFQPTISTNPVPGQCPYFLWNFHEAYSIHQAFSQAVKASDDSNKVLFPVVFSSNYQTIHELPWIYHFHTFY